ncbi:hypothetical protein ABPG74_022158 [Tetrahymena malaccensis]
MDRVVSMKKNNPNFLQNVLKSPSQILKLKGINVINQVASIYIGPKLLQIFLSLESILREDNISYDSLYTWANQYGFNLVGMATGALIGYKLCQILSITNPHLNFISILTMTYIGDKTVDFIKLYSVNYKLQKEDILEILEMDLKQIDFFINFIQEHYLEISLYYILQYK